MRLIVVDKYARDEMRRVFRELQGPESERNVRNRREASRPHLRLLEEEEAHDGGAEDALLFRADVDAPALVDEVLHVEHEGKAIARLPSRAEGRLLERRVRSQSAKCSIRYQNEGQIARCELALAQRYLRRLADAGIGAGGLLNQ